MINSLGGAARPIPGTDVFVCRKAEPVGLGGEVLDLGYVGEVIRVNTEPLVEYLHQGITPVVSPTARGVDGKIYNCNADVAAAQAAIALRARRLVFMSDVPGLLRDPRDPASLIASLRVGEVDTLRAAGVIDQGMIPKVESAVAALRAGVDKVWLLDGRVNHAVLLEIFTDAGVGTEVIL
jgi:acetylglutamate kinase